jgi:hypothetical protein
MRLIVVLGAAAVVTGCTIAPAPADGPSAANSGLLPPPGYGTLLQREVSISLASRDLEILVTPLHESVIRMTAPDTYQRLSAIANAHRTTSSGANSIFLVSFFSERPDVRFVPEEVQFISRGLRVRPGSITPTTPTWGQRRIQQRRTETAVYSFVGEVDLESDLVLAYGLDETSAWSVILPRIQAERARARARAGIGG